MIYLLLENTKYGVNVSAFINEKLRKKAVKELLKEYSKEYDKNIDSIEELNEVTFNEVWIDLFETEVSK